MSGQRMLYVAVEYKDARGITHQRGAGFSASVDDRETRDLLHRGILSLSPIRRTAGENSARVTGESQK